MKKFAIIVFAMVLAAGTAGAAQIFYESFESPVVGGTQNGTDPTGWIDTSAGSQAGLGYLVGSGYLNVTGNQAAWLNCYNTQPQIETTASVFSSNLLANARYTLRFNAAADTTSYMIYADLLAGTNLVTTASVIPTTANFSNHVAQAQWIARNGDPGIGQMLKLRLRVAYSGYPWGQQCYVDNMSLDINDTSGDITPPTPNPMQWAGSPTSSVNNSITMQAINATDLNLAQYYFTNTVNGHVSGWQDSPIWTDTNLEIGATNSYMVKARDKSSNLNETGWSSLKSTVVEPYIILYESFEVPAVSGDIGWSAFPYYTPVGWYGQSCSMRKSGGVITTPYGLQVVDVAYTGGPTSSRAEATNFTAKLTAEYTYTLTFAAGNILSWSGVQFTSELIAGTTVVTNLIAETSNNNMSENFSIVFSPNSSHPNLGQILKVRFYHSDVGQWQATAVFDNIKLKAVPPPGPTVLKAASGGTAGSVLLNWTAMPSATGYNIKRSLTNSGYVTVGTASSTNYTDYNLKFLTRYYYVVSYTNAYVESAPSPAVSIKLPVPSTVILIR